MSNTQLDDIIKKILAIKKFPPGTSAGLTKNQIYWLCDTVCQIFEEQPVFLELQPPLTICGDIHGQFHDLLRIFDKCKYPPHTNYLFLGDYVDRGCQSIETVCLLFAFKIRYPENFFMLRGNHECQYINSEFGFQAECLANYDYDVWRKFNSVFCYLPVAAVIDDKIFCVHGGLSPSLMSLDDIRNIERPTDVPEDGLLCDLLWSDPDPDAIEWEENDRGTSYTFGLNPLKRFLARFHFDLVCRAHQAVMNGFEFPFNTEDKKETGLVTVFSAPNYCYEYDNRAAMLSVKENLFCTFSVLAPKKWEEEYEIEPRPGTPPREAKGQQQEELQLQYQDNEI